MLSRGHFHIDQVYTEKPNNSHHGQALGDSGQVKILRGRNLELNQTQDGQPSALTGQVKKERERERGECEGGRERTGERATLKFISRILPEIIVINIEEQEQAQLR